MSESKAESETIIDIEDSRLWIESVREWFKVFGAGWIRVVSPGFESLSES